ncbi:hypothetical protein MAR_021665 [Mya arenaria]|uniref:Uncharacterized protein n=1 Tax=Mya arenaria TaxID=6604 RepID=A0ABY7EGL9_MYAAR|nr:hypothetical protein MAR_021665 [Mya arenaria]
MAVDGCILYIAMMKATIKEILCYLLLPLVANTVSGEVNLTASGSFIDNTYVVKTGSSIPLFQYAKMARAKKDRREDAENQDEQRKQA